MISSLKEIYLQASNLATTSNTRSRNLFNVTLTSKLCNDQYRDNANKTASSTGDPYPNFCQMVLFFAPQGRMPGLFETFSKMVVQTRMLAVTTVDSSAK